VSDAPWRVERDGALTVLTLHRPPVNLFDGEVEAGLREAVLALADEPPRGLLVRAEGRVWTGGVDVAYFEGMTPEECGVVWRRGFEVVRALEELPCPIVFAAHATCLTWGFELALACDLLAASERATFGLVEVRVGLTPSFGGPQRLAERVGPARARRMVMSGEILDAATLESWGAVTHVFAEEEFEAASRALARELAEGPTRAHAATKELVRAQIEGGARAADELVPRVSGALMATEDFAEAVRSFRADGPGRARYRGR
jgi:enoyl-CoA hydratase/carnithine racemase